MKDLPIESSTEWGLYWMKTLLRWRPCPSIKLPRDMAHGLSHSVPALSGHIWLTLFCLVSERGKTDLYKVKLLIREANKLSQQMKMPTVSTGSPLHAYYTVIATMLGPGPAESCQDPSGPAQTRQDSLIYLVFLGMLMYSYLYISRLLDQDSLCNL